MRWYRWIQPGKLKHVEGGLVFCGLYTELTVQFRWRKISCREKVWTSDMIIIFLRLLTVYDLAALSKHWHNCNCKMEGYPSFSNSESQLIDALLKLIHSLIIRQLCVMVKLRWAASLCTQHQVFQKSNALLGNHSVWQNCRFCAHLPSVCSKCKEDMLTLKVSW